MDRPYCSNEVFRQLVLDNSSTSEAECRLSIEERLGKCNRETCPPCVSPCNFPTAKAIADVLKCFRSEKHFGYLHYYMVSDAGQLALSMHGAVRSTGYAAVPEKLSKHLYSIAQNNPTGLLQRDSVSCRLEHRNSPMPHLTPGFDDDGNPVSRSGYMVPCKKHSDCYPCGRHPLTGQFFQCQKIHTFYDTVRTNSDDEAEDGGISFLNVSSASASAFDIDMEDAAIDGRVGVCVDLDSSMNEGCGNEVMANIKDGLVGCLDGGVGKFLCGLALTVQNGDLTTVQTEGNLGWPRLLLNGSEDGNGDGLSGERMECTDPFGAFQCRFPCTQPSPLVSFA